MLRRVRDAVFIVLLFGGLYGFLYPVLVGATLAICAMARHGFHPRPRQWVPLALPAATYYVLEYLVAKRQEWNVPHTVLALSAVGCAVVLAACLAGRPSWLPIGAAIGVCAAVGLWWLVPRQGWNRLF